VGAAGRGQAVQHAQGLEDLQAAGLEALAAGAVERPCQFVDQEERDPAPGEVEGQHQARGAGATDQDIGMRLHGLLQNVQNAHMEDTVMARSKNVQDTHIPARVRELHGALIAIASVMNRPRNDQRLVAAAGIRLDQALFRLLVAIERMGPIGVVELAERLGRDYTTVSRQVARLEAMELVTRRGNAQDRRIREALVAPKGKEMTDRLDEARARLAREAFREWPERDVDELVRLMTRFAAELERLEARPD